MHMPSLIIVVAFLCLFPVLSGLWHYVIVPFGVRSGWFVALLLCASPALGGHCVQRQVVHQQYYANAVVLKQITPYAYYSVGVGIQEEAQAERIARLVSAKVSAKLKLEQKAMQPEGAAILTQKCANCHKAKSKAVTEDGAPELFDNLGQWTGTSEQAAMGRALAKKGLMPPAPAKELDDDEYLSAKSYLDSIGRQGEQRAPVPPRAPRPAPSDAELNQPAAPNEDDSASLTKRKVR